MVSDQHRDLLEIASEFMRFFIHESCGYCTPCRVGNTSSRSVWTGFEQDTDVRRISTTCAT
ncbi:MAG: NADH-ubiquinone oxidoreductase-F iron-sulfur binding region domain-containing protein [Candidatus Eisenbacteria bacterium]